MAGAALFHYGVERESFRFQIPRPHSEGGYDYVTVVQVTVPSPEPIVSVRVSHSGPNFSASTVTCISKVVASWDAANHTLDKKEIVELLALSSRNSDLAIECLQESEPVNARRLKRPSGSSSS